MNVKLNRRQLLHGACATGGALALEAAGTPAGAAATDPATMPAGSGGGHWFGYALNTATIRPHRLDLIQEIETAGRAGYDGIELWMNEIQRHASSGGSLKDIAKRCADLGLKVCGGVGFAAWLVDDDAQRAKAVEQLKRDMEVLAQVGGRYIAAPPTGANRPGAKIDLDRAAERYRAILDLGGQTGVVPQIELWGTSPNLGRIADAIYVAAKADHADGCILPDVFHMYKAGDGPAALHMVSRGAIHCIHLNDYPADPPREQARDSHRTWPGDGVAPLKQILGHLAANHCRVMLSLELFLGGEAAKLPAGEVAKTGLAKMKAVVRAAGFG